VVESKLAFLDVASSICDRISGEELSPANGGGVVWLDLSLCGVAFFLLRSELVRQSRHDTSLAEYHASVQHKNLLSAGLYFSAAPLAYVSIYISFFIFVLIPAMYFFPEKKLARAGE